MNNSQNYIAEKSVFPSKIVTNPSKISEKEQNVENQDNFVNQKPSGAFKIFFESNLNKPDTRAEKNLKIVKNKSCKDKTLREISEGRKRVRKNSRKNQTDVVKNLVKPSNASSIPVPIPGKFHSVKQKAPKGGFEADKLDSALDSNDKFKNDILKPSKSYIIDSLKTEQKFPSNVVQSKPNSILDNKPSDASNSIFPKDLNFSRKNSESGSNRASFIKPIISDIGKRRINEILKGHAQKVVKEKISLIKDIKDVKEANPGESKVETVIQDIILVANAEVKPEKKENINLEEKNSKITEKSSKIVEQPNKDSKNSEEDSKNDKEDSKGEEKRKLPVTWASLPQSKELERRLKTSEAASLFLNSKYHKVDEQNKAGDEKKQKGDGKGKNKATAQKTKPNNEKEDEKKEKRESYTDRLLLLKLLGKDLEDKKKAIEVNEQFNQITNVEKPHTPKKATSSRVVAPNNLLKPLTPKEMVIIQERKESSPVIPIKVEKLFDSEPIVKPKQTRSAELRDLVTQAIKDHKIFCVFDNHTYIVRPVREELLNRGWLEIIPDRRLIPRRRPPPLGPVIEKTPERISVERNWNTLEAILTAKQRFADELQETVLRSSSFKYTIEKPKTIATAIESVKKGNSHESIQEVKSHFAIIPPNNEKKKTNVDIRDFVAKYNAILEKVKERENDIKKLKEKERNAKNQKRDKSKTVNEKNKLDEEEQISEQDARPPLSTKKSIQKIVESIKDNNEVLRTVVTGIDNFEEKVRGNLTIGVLYDKTHRNSPAIKFKENLEQEKKDKQSEKPAQANNVFKPAYTENEARTISKIIQSANARIHFMWLSIKPATHLKCFNYSPEIINKFQKTTFCTKIGLWSHLSNIQWYAHEVTHPAKSPRMYNTGEADDLQAFFQDFQLTACIGMLKWISDTFFEKGLKGVHAKKGKVPLKAFEFAIKQCEKYIRFKENEDLTAYEDFNVLEDEWNTFLQWFYSITNDQGKVQESSTAQLMVVYTRAAETLKLMRRYWPEIDIDGRLNIWIMKPYCASCGRGIFMTNNMYYIGQHSKYIVQKYIEKPLLIYNTKFDIRQWFMITKLTPLEIWMYKECYLRFCSQPFVLRNLHESVHLSNNSVQRKYIFPRDQYLPDQNMWDSKTFQLYLRTIGQPSVWDDIIYPGMKDAIVSTMLAAQDTFDGPRKSWFEVYGADFMLSSNLKDGPWLIEINENPAMDPSTKVTARLCPQMLRDVIKVVVDKRANRNANTGQWELVYRQNFSPSYGIVNLDVRGKKIAKSPNPLKFCSEYATQKACMSDRRHTEDSSYAKLYGLGNNFGKDYNQSLEKFRSRKKVINLKKIHEQDEATKMTESQLLKAIDRHIAHETWGAASLKVKEIKSDTDKAVVD